MTSRTRPALYRVTASSTGSIHTATVYRLPAGSTREQLVTRCRARSEQEAVREAVRQTRFARRCGGL
jgi:hypothetical protein